jgi:hypothetical protein
MQRMATHHARIVSCSMMCCGSAGSGRMPTLQPTAQPSPTRWARLCLLRQRRRPQQRRSTRAPTLKWAAISGAANRHYVCMKNIWAIVCPDRLNRKRRDFAGTQACCPRTRKVSSPRPRSTPLRGAPSCSASLRATSTLWYSHRHQRRVRLPLCMGWTRWAQVSTRLGM